MRIYATEQELTDWTGSPVDLAVPLLRAASSLVEDVTVTALYRTDVDGYPADPELRAAFRDAVCAQAESWAALGIDPRKGTAGVSGERVVASKGLGSAQITYAVAERAADDRAAALAQLSEQAASILRGALPHGVVGVR